MKKKVDTSLLSWTNKPTHAIVGKTKVIIESEPFTDLWSQTYFHTTKSNATLLTLPIEQNFTFSAKVEFKFKRQFDQAGIILYANGDNYVKLCIEYMDETASLMSVVVTHHGFSDWSSFSVASGLSSMYFRLSCLDGDVKCENSGDGVHYKQMRIFHLRRREEKYQVGLFLASPLDSCFEAHFSELYIEDCVWKRYKEEQ